MINAITMLIFLDRKSFDLSSNYPPILPSHVPSHDFVNLRVQYQWWCPQLTMQSCVHTQCFQSKWKIINHLPTLVFCRSATSNHCETSENVDIASIPSFGATRVSIVPKKSNGKGVMFDSRLLHAFNVRLVDEIDFCHRFERENHSILNAAHYVSWFNTPHLA